MSGLVLVVDDLASNQLLTEAQLTAAGYDVVLASNGAAALEALTRRPEIEVVLLDAMMPGMDGFETCRRIRELPHGRELPIVFLTASREGATHIRALESGADDFLHKPIDRTELLLRVRSLVRIRRLQLQRALLTNLLVHDLKNPVTGIISNAEFARDESKEPARGAIEDVLSAAGLLQRMVMNLLDIGRAEDGMLRPASTTIDLAQLLEPIVAGNRRRLGIRRLRIDVCTEGVVRGDPDLLSRVLQNLLDNAVRYAPAGSTIAIDFQKTDTTTRLKVRDEGPGIPVDARARIFEKYGQATETAKTDRATRGLGLLFCRLVAEAHRGRIWVEDNAPRGTAFVLELPL